MKNAKGAAGDVSEETERNDHTVRIAGPDDAETIAVLVRELAIYEKLEQHAKATAEDFRRHLFGPRPAAEAAIAEAGGKAVGFALWFSTFSTFRGQPGLYLEDIFVRPEFRGAGSARRYWPPWPPGRSSGAARGWNGQCSIGIIRRSDSTGRWALNRWTSGRSIGSMKDHCGDWRNLRAEGEVRLSTRKRYDD